MILPPSRVYPARPPRLCRPASFDERARSGAYASRSQGVRRETCGLKGGSGARIQRGKKGRNVGRTAGLAPMRRLKHTLRSD
eukprot:4543766-Alexandrium_andersonii.AAC.1